MSIELTYEKLLEIKAQLNGTCKSLTEVIEEHELIIGEDELEDRLLDPPHDIERCGGCEWWFEVHELEFDEEANKSMCEQCGPDLHGS